VTLRLCADQHRARSRLHRSSWRLAGREDESSPEERVCDIAEAAWLAARVATLPAHQQRVVRARAIGLSCADAASHLGTTVDAVKSAVARARTTVRSALASTYGLFPAFFGKSKLATLFAGGAVAGVTVGGLLIAIHPSPPAPPATQRPPAAERPEVTEFREIALPGPAPVPATPGQRPAAPPPKPKPKPKPTPTTTPTLPGLDDPVPPCPEGETRNPAGVCEKDTPRDFWEETVYCLEHVNLEPPLPCSDPEEDQ
jgi:hypothetical protein